MTFFKECLSIRFSLGYVYLAYAINPCPNAVLSQHKHAVITKEKKTKS